MSTSENSIPVEIAKNVAIIIGTLVVINVVDKGWKKLRTKKEQ